MPSRSPAFLATSQPSDALSPSASALVPLAHDLPPAHRPGREEGLPGFWVVPFRRAVILRPRGMRLPLAPKWCRRCCLRRNQSLRHPGLQFSRLTPTAHLLAYLRIAGLISEVVARLATDLPGSALAGRDSHPLDDILAFLKPTTSSFPPDQPFLVALVALHGPVDEAKPRSLAGFGEGAVELADVPPRAQARYLAPRAQGHVTRIVGRREPATDAFMS